MTIRVTSKRNGFYRCGIPHPAEPVDHADDRFTEEELERLQAEPMLVVEVIDGEDPNEGLEAVIAKIGELDPNDEKAFTNGGKPDATVLGDLLNRKVPAAERDQAWAEFQRRQQGEQQ